MSKEVLVIGGGVAGIQASLDLADQGTTVYLVERLPSIGGKMAQLDKTFPTNDCSICIMGPKLFDVERHPDTQLLTYAEVEKVTGQAGDFTVKVRKKARFVDEDKCTACGLCAEKCPVTIPDKFNMNMGTRSAIYKYFPQGVPSIYTIDDSVCRVFQGKKCSICAKICEAKAINFEQKDTVFELKVGAIIVATGFDVFDPSDIKPYGYGTIPDVITAMEFERLLNASGPTGGHLERPSSLNIKAEIKALEKQVKSAKKRLKNLEKKGEEPQDEVKNTITESTERLAALKEKAPSLEDLRDIAFVQCVGSRDLRFNSHCCSFGCMHSVKEAVVATEHGLELNSTIFFTDMRAYGKGFHEYCLRGASEYGIQFVRGRVAEIGLSDDNKPVIWCEDMDTRKVEQLPFDLVVLATACVPSKGMEELAQMMGFDLDDSGFVKTAPERPVSTSVNGIFVCGCAEGPMDIPSSVSLASAAASMAVQTVMETQ
ncbi:MAG: CoB--CoM heterodisulfide reductase iron-sulfur subunit A family protein [Deltaproteobacteria bacterium]|nr:CoB--CoM heterodisulfide reductase iron-sulfur subunit A family protein [Deltaproteobacteria bacterium]MBW2170565.1 CoB--CoM heterodisulfide reductase iron-sulfur subunit A family protein [Deltaproteobacteria bacterium]MBW2258926.1 CoB--CoM heterodisulfide reductase iron-sulfur subunit A family protein [Deltaproteobacteria bacterium]